MFPFSKSIIMPKIRLLRKEKPKGDRLTNCRNMINDLAIERKGFKFFSKTETLKLRINKDINGNKKMKIENLNISEGRWKCKPTEPETLR